MALTEEQKLENRRLATRRYYEKDIEKSRAYHRSRYHDTKHLKKTPTEDEKRLIAIKDRERKLRKHYGMSLDTFEELLSSQNNVCAICCKPEYVRKTLVVDHCHTSGKVRGLLCSKCNTAIGALGDTSNTVQKAVDYLKKAELE